MEFLKQIMIVLVGYLAAVFIFAKPVKKLQMLDRIRENNVKGKWNMKLAFLGLVVGVIVTVSANELLELVNLPAYKNISIGMGGGILYLFSEAVGMNKKY